MVLRVSDDSIGRDLQFAANFLVAGDVASWFQFTDAMVESLETFYGETFDEVSLYALGRLLAAHRPWDTFDVSECTFALGKFMTFSPAGRVRFSLLAEYGRILDSLLEVNFQVVSVPLRNIVMPVLEHAEKAQQEVGMFREDTPVALVVASGRSFRVIDGYHRVMHAGLQQVEMVKVLVAY